MNSHEHLSIGAFHVDMLVVSQIKNQFLKANCTNFQTIIIHINANCALDSFLFANKSVRDLN